MTAMKQSTPSLMLLFLRTFVISACTFGGGFVIAGLMKKEFVDKRGWLEEDEMMDFVAIAQSCPGAIAVNAAILVGFRLRGLAGVAAAALGTILPPLLIISLISVFYSAFSASRAVGLMLRGMQAGVAAVIMDVALSLGIRVAKNRRITDMAVMVLAFAAFFFLKISAVWIVLAVLLLGVVRVLWGLRKKVGK